VSARLVAENGSGSVYERSLDAIGRLARFEISLDGSSGEAVGTIALDGATVEVLPSASIDPAEVRGRIEAQRRDLRSEIARASGKLANEGFTDKAPADLVQAERDKLERLEAELAELEE